ncbi:FAD-dependent oxidoreductase [Sinimarinibacterium flocculans]|uniref:FAD-dependent oxidoreductase n=1 Tax=Sinimarinibacterium flocculans TaxID=985250 RepID=UPI00248F71C1|nr:FAD-dependent oxidoreductase [Sinimarinibacterium flocculans]
MNDQTSSRRRFLKSLGLAAAGAATLNVDAAMPMGRGDVRRWDLETDLLIVGSGVAGVSAAIEARRSNIAALMLERQHLPGGSSGISGGVCYLGGGTPLQKALGFEDSVEAMLGYMLAASGPYASTDKIQLYCEQSLEHFDWFVANGVRYAQKYSDEKEISIPDGSLYHCGSERAWPFREQFKPAPRGHVPPSEHLTGGRELMRALLAAADALGARLIVNAEAQRLIVETDGRIAGARIHLDGKVRHVRARRGVVLAAGGFIHDAEMVTTYAPELAACSTPWGRAGDLGIGIRMGIAAGGATLRMHHGFVITPMYPPETILRGIAVNAAGQRFTPEDGYYGMVGHDIAYRQNGRAWMIVDADSAYGWNDFRLPVAAEAADIATLEKMLALPDGALLQTVDYYNRHAEHGRDPLFHKEAKFIAPLQTAPFKAYDLSTHHAFTPAHTFGGLHTDLDARVLDAWNEPIPGLYAAGRSSAGLPVAPYIASGVSIGDGSFFGRRAARHAARA